METAVSVQGRVDVRFEAVRDAFAANFAERGDVGAACCVYRDGQSVVDIWGGRADPETDRPWQANTLQLVFSASKGATAICTHMLVERGVLDLDAPVARYWPEFGAAGKAEIPVRWVLSHRAGLAAVEGDLTLDEVLAWDPVVEAIAAQPPNWEPGSAHGYHVRSFGWILGELVRRTTGRTLGHFLAEEVAEPLGLCFWIGLPDAQRARVARLLPPAGDANALARALGDDALTVRAANGPSDLFRYNDMWNRPELLAAEMPSSNGVGDARSLARIYAATIGEVDGIRLLSTETLATACSVQADGRDLVLLQPARYALGFMRPPMLATGCGPRAFGHPGAGGSLAFADPARGMTAAYVMNRMRLGLEPDPRAAALVDAIYRCLD